MPIRFFHNTMWTLKDEIEYRRCVERMARQDAAEKKGLKSVPSRVLEVFDGPVVTANITEDGDYG